MNGFKQCSIGHFYKDSLDACPYCPKSSINQQTEVTNSGLSDKTQISGMPTEVGANRTEVSMGNGDATQATQIFGGGGIKNDQMKRDFSKTHIQGLDIDEENNSIVVKETRQARKIVGWIISYSLDAMGLDFRIYEGNNTIGRDPANNITITNDSAISSKHLTILYRLGKFYMQDEMAVNGTYINGELIEIGKPYELNDGDVIGLGGTTKFKFKSAL